MRIRELLLKNFGKFTDREIIVSEGIHILYGENESGKSTVHTFIKAMLFGLERGRGRAAVGDTFSLYEPWENPNYYSGRLRFETGGRNFVIERNFDRYGKRTSVLCEDDGEELSVERGDLKMLLDGLTPGDYDDTVSIAQLRARPGSSLAAELKNYATNYYVAGDSDLNLEAALEHLRDRRKDAEKRMKESVDRKQAERDKMEQEASYIWRDIYRITREQEELEEKIAYREAHKERERPEDIENRRKIDEVRPSKWRIHPVEILIFAVLVAASFVFIPRPWNYFLTIVLFLFSAIYVWNRLKVGKKVEKTEPEIILEEIAQEEQPETLERLTWELEHNAEELRDKQIQYENIKEQLEELDEISDEQRGLEKKKRAMTEAIQRIEQLSASFQDKMRQDLDAYASRILSDITDGKYTRLVVEDGLALSLLSGGRKIPIASVSQGTIEQVYFSLRMAAGELLYEEDYPVILDDTFVCYDDKRLERALKWLYENKKQILLFTCQKREEEALRRMEIPYVKTELYYI